MGKIIQGETLEELKKMKDESVDAIITDPPYGLDYEDWDSELKFSTFMRNWVHECYRVLKTGGTLWSFMSVENVCELLTVLNFENYNVDKRNWIVWARQKGRNASKHLKSSREDIVYATKGKPKTYNSLSVLRDVIAPYRDETGKPRGWFVNNEGKRVRWSGLGNIWVFSQPLWSSKEEKQYHPNQKPLMMMERLIRICTNEGDVVLDPFAGSGSTLVACKKSNRDFIGIEQNIDYVNIINDRLNVATVERLEKMIHTQKEIEEYKVNLKQWM